MTADEPVEQLIQKLKSYAPDANVDLVRRAYDVATHAHAQQTRASGEPYIGHPLEVANILADLHFDATTLAAALLHDVPEDTAVTLDQVRAQFGEEVARLVDGMTKLERIRKLSGSREGAMAEAQAENVRKILLAMKFRMPRAPSEAKQGSANIVTRVTLFSRI